MWRIRCTSSRGSALLVVCAVAGILLTVVTVLHYQESVSRAAVMTAEGDLEARQAAQFDLGRQLGRTNEPTPKFLVVTNRSRSDRAPLIGPNAAANLFDGVGTGLRNLWDRGKATFNPKVSTGAGCAYFGFTPGSGGFGLRFGTPGYLGVATENSFCAIAAPQGAIRVAGTTASWSNPSGGESTSASVPLDLEAGSGADLNGLQYGHVWCNSGSLKLKQANQAFNGVAHWGLSPRPLDVKQLVSDCDNAMSTLSKSAVDKTADLTTGAPDISSVYQGLSKLPWVEDTGIVDNIGMRGTTEYPLGIFVTVSSLMKSQGLLSLDADVPYIPDGGDDTAWDSAVETVIEAWMTALDQLKWLNKPFEELDEAIQSVEGTPWEWAKYFLEAEKLVIGGAMKAIVTAVQTLATAVLFPAILMQMTAQKEPPNTRDEEDQMAASGSISKLGRKRWAYRDFFGGFFGDFVFGLDPSRFGRQFKAIVGVFTDGAFAGLNDTFNMNEKLKLVWFGRNDLSGFGLTGPITLPVTLDVPRDRTLRVANGLTVQRDLWLQRGSCLVVDGNLSISGGRLIIEDGATLVVNGNLTCSGTARGGSIVVGGVMKSVHPITCSILCSGDVEIPYGTRSGFAWDDAAMPLIPSTLALLQQLAGGRAANLAKSDGPFHPRLPYVASCETSFVIVLPPLPMMFPSPYQKKNIDASIMRGLSILYAATLNAKVGENFMTYSDWWFSPGMVPEALKADFDVFGTVVMSPALGGELAANPDDALTAAANATSKDARRRFMYAARTAVWERYVLAAATFAVDALNGKLAAAKKYTLPPGSAAIVGLAFPSLVEGIDKLETDVKASQPDTTALTGVLQLCGKAMGWATIWPTLTAQQVRQECGGLLLYARGGIRVGYLAGKPVARTDCALAAGLFVARGDVKMNAETTVGALRSRDGSVSVEGDMWFYPPFTRASLYRTKAEQPGWTERMLSSRYGGDDKRPEDQRCLPVGWGSPLRTSAWGPSR